MGGGSDKEGMVISGLADGSSTLPGSGTPRKDKRKGEGDSFQDFSRGQQAHRNPEQQ